MKSTISLRKEKTEKLNTSKDSSTEIVQTNSTPVSTRHSSRSVVVQKSNQVPSAEKSQPINSVSDTLLLPSSIFVPVSHHINDPSPSSSNKRRFVSVDELVDFQSSQKQQRTAMVPEDRKAFFAILSLLVDKSKWQQSLSSTGSNSSNMSLSFIKLETSNSESKSMSAVSDASTLARLNYLESFIPPEKLSIFLSLKTILLYDC